MKLLYTLISSFAVLIIFISLYFGFRQIHAFIMLLGITLVYCTIFIKIQEKIADNLSVTRKNIEIKTLINSVFFFLTTLVVCGSTLLWVDDNTKIFGDGYDARLAYEERQHQSNKLKLDEMDKISASERLISMSLKDPSSAEFSGSRIGNNGAVCGTVNAKNSFGAYTGYKRFIQIGTFSYVSDDSSDFNREWRQICE